MAKQLVLLSLVALSFCNFAFADEQALQDFCVADPNGPGIATLTRYNLFVS